MSGLFDVAEHLSSRAKLLAGDEADAFGRSAFNRYYYASFLTVRDLLVILDASWAKERHANIPMLLEGTLIKRVKALAKRQEAAGALSEARRRVLIKQAMSAVGEIASILREAYAVRVAADYEPTHTVVFDVSGFRLVEHSDAEARNWKARVEQRKGVLLRISKELGFDD